MIILDYEKENDKMNELTTNKPDVKFKPNWLGLKMMLKGGSNE